MKKVWFLKDKLHVLFFTVTVVQIWIAEFVEMFALILLFICISVGKVATLMNSLSREEILDSRYMVLALVCRVYLVTCNFWKLKLSRMHPKCDKWKIHTNYIEWKISDSLTNLTLDQNWICVIRRYFNILDIIWMSFEYRLIPWY